MREWREYKLGDVAEVKYGKAHQGLADGKIPAYGSGGLMRYVETALYADESILIPRKGTLNNIIYKDEPFWTVDTMFYTVLNKHLIFPKFLFYQLSRIDFASMNVGSAVPSMTVPILNDIDLLAPSLPEQTAIAEVLSSLDDKIDLLHRQNKTLEQLAETLFRHWFVEEAEESWEEKRLGDIAHHSKENVNPSKFPEEVFYHYSLPAFDEGKHPKAEKGVEILSNKYRIPPNSILISKLNPRFPRIWEIFGPEIKDNSVCSTEFQIAKPKELKYFEFIYCFLKSNSVTQELAGAAGGTSGSHQRVNPEDIFNLSFLNPPEGKIDEFHSIVKEHLQKIKSNTTQIRTLTQLRDTLLPKLMSGEVRVKG